MKKVLLTVSACACVLTGLVAVACDKTEEVSYKFDTLCDVSVEDITVNRGDEFTLPVPSRGKEWEFAGWYPNSDLTGDPVTSVVADMGTTYYAKWTPLYKLTLNLNGGSLAGADDLYLKAGENVSSYLANYTPSKGTNYRFGRWLLNGNPLDGNLRMTSNGLSLTAEYKVAYTLDVYTQSIDYLRGEAEEEFEKKTETLYDYAEADYTISYELTGFSVKQSQGGELKYEPQQGDNRFAIYFNRNQYTLELNPNVDNTTQREVKAQYYYDEVVELPYDLYMNAGYVFEGWSESRSGKNDYPIRYIDEVLYNKDGSDDSGVVREKEYRVKETTTLYAYWNKGYSDLFGGADTIFLLDGNAKNIYLLRGDKYFKGDYDSKKKEFTFYNKEEDVIFEGKLLGNNTFCYSNESRSEVSINMYTVANGVDENVTLQFDSFDELYYTVKGENGSTTANGTFVIEDDGTFTASFTSGSGSVVGKTVRFLLGSVSGKTVFVVRNEEEAALGTLRRFVVVNGSITTYRENYYDLTLDGYGNAVYYSGSSETNCRYTYNEENKTYELTDSRGRAVISAKLLTVNGKQGYVVYNSDLNGEFTCNDGSLRLDGLVNATYSDSTYVSGYYSASASYVGSYIVTVSDNGATYKFRLKSDEEGGYIAEPMLDGYAEYVYYALNDKGEGSLFYPVLVLDDEVAGKANLYVNFDSTLTKGASGNYGYDAASGLYTLTDIQTVAGVTFEGSKLPLDDMSAFVFALEALSNGNDVYYLYRQTGLDDAETDNTKSYYSVDKNGDPLNDGSELLIVGGIAIFTERNNDGTLIGTYQTDSKTNITVITSSTGNTMRYIFMEIDEAKGTFLRYDYAPYTAYLYKEDGTAEQYHTMSFDGKGGVTYSYREDASDKDSTVTIRGAVQETENKLNNSPVYLFDAGDESFRYILIRGSSNYFFAKISTKAGRYISANSGILKLDGTGLEATYSDISGDNCNGRYFARAEGEDENGKNYSVIYVYDKNRYFYFKLYEDKTFIRLGSEYGNYIVLDNQNMDGRFVTLDGEKKASIYRIPETSGEERAVIAENVEYDFNEDGTISIEYSVGGVPHTLTGRTGTMQVGNSYYSTFFIQYDSIANTYVNESDYSVLMLNDTGSALRFLSTGGVERGSYTLITDSQQEYKDGRNTPYNLLYYINDKRTFAAVYEYTSDNLISIAASEELTYCNEELSTLTFTQYGFAIFDGTTQYYYYQEATDDQGNYDIVIFRSDRNDPNANDYGFVKDYIEGGFSKKIAYNSDEYYKNSGFEVSFKRDTSVDGDRKIFFPEDDKEYALENISFLLSGNSAFSVRGEVTLSVLEDGKTNTVKKNCTIVRNLSDADTNEYETYVLIGTYRYDIDIGYAEIPSQCSFRLKKMSFYIEAESYNYLYTLQMYAMFLGSVPAIPSFGKITVWQEYDAEGKPFDKMYMSGTFNKINYPLYDINGELIDFEAQPCTFENNAYTVTFEHTDGYTYTGVFAINSKTFNQNVFQLAVFYREQEFESNGYTLTAGRIIASDSQSFSPGSLAVLRLKDIGFDKAIKIGDNWYIISRTYSGEEGDADRVIVSTTYYKVVLKEVEAETFKENVVKPYESAIVTKVNAETIYTDDGSGRYVDIDTDGNKVLAFFLRGTGYSAAIDSVYSGDSDNGYYIITTSSGLKFKITIETEDGNKTATIENYVDPAEEEEDRQ